MTKYASRSLADSLRGIGNESPLVQTKRTAVLCARGLLELLVQRALNAAETLANGVYQQNLTTPIRGKNKLGPIGAAQLTEVLEALPEAVSALNEAVQNCSCFEVGIGATSPALAVIAEELDDCTKRLAQVATLQNAWRKALTEYNNLRPPTPDTLA